MRAMMLVVSAIAFSSSAQGQVNDVTERLINPWYYCVGQATGRQPDRFRSPEESVERAFIACQTEEMAVRSYAELASLPPAQINAIIAKHRLDLKRSLVSKLVKN